MPPKKINFFTEDIPYTLSKKMLVRDWLTHVITSERAILRELNFIFCSDDYLLVLNQQYLSHDTYTDVITFDNSGVAKTIVGDIFISIDRVKENASTISTPFYNELLRVMVHGTLHLLGYKDKSAVAKKQMTAKEDHYLALFAG